MQSRSRIHSVPGGEDALSRRKALDAALKPGDMVIMDNLGSHKGYAVRRAIRRREASVPAALQFLTSILSSI